LEAQLIALNKMLTPWPRHGRLLCLLSIVLIIGAVALAEDAWQLAEQATEDEARLVRLHKRVAPKVQAKPSRTELDEQKRWTALDAERAFDWYPIFLALERASEADIELLEFEPDKPGRRILLRGEARNIEALTDYMERLSEQGVFSQIYLAHEKIKLKDRLSTLTFEIRASMSAP
jgi:hypothetical protein